MSIINDFKISKNLLLCLSPLIIIAPLILVAAAALLIAADYAIRSGQQDENLPNKINDF